MPAFRVGHFDDWPTLGWELVDWVEAYLPHGPGDVEGDPLELDDEWVQVLLDLYRLFPRGHDRAGQRVVSRGVLSRPKGRAKSELAGMVVCIEACGPARFDGWNAHHDPVGRPVRSPFIRCLATEESQVGNTYDNVTYMLDHAAEHHPQVFAGIDLGRSPQGSTRIYLPASGEIRPSTASSAAKDGGKETCAVADETHLMYLPELRGMHRMVSRNLRKRKLAEPWMFDTTTGHLPAQGSVGEDAYKRAQEFLDGSRVRTGGFYWNHREGTEVADWEDDVAVLAALREAYGKAAEAGWVDLERILTDDIRAPEATEADSRRYWLNQIHLGSNSAFDPKSWAACSRPETVFPSETLITLGLAGGRFTDGTSVIATAVAEGHQWPLGIWERPEEWPANKEWEVPEAEVDGVVTEAFERYTVWRFYANPPYWESSIDAWAGRYGPKKVIGWRVNRPQAMAYAVRAFSASLKTTELSQDGDGTFARHIGRCMRRPTAVSDDKGRPMWTIGKENDDSPRAIHAGVAAVLSWEARGDAIASGALEEEDAGELVSW